MTCMVWIIITENEIKRPEKMNLNHCHILFNKHSPKWRWIVVDIYQAGERQGKYLPLSTTLRWIIVLGYTMQAE